MPNLGWAKRDPGQGSKWPQRVCFSCGDLCSQQDVIIQLRTAFFQLFLCCDLAGRPWRVDELRIKSNSDLHKLWYVLLKERNMLLTMQHEYERQSELFPNPERIEKVGCWGMCTGEGGSVFVKGFVFYLKFKLWLSTEQGYFELCFINSCQ